MRLFTAYVDWIVSSFSMSHLFLITIMGGTLTSFVKIQCCVMEFQIWKFSCSIFRSIWLFVLSWTNIIRVVSCSRALTMTMNIHRYDLFISIIIILDHHCIMLSISSNRRSSPFTNLICVISINFRGVIYWFISPIPWV